MGKTDERYRQVGLTPTEYTASSRFSNGQLTPELIDGLIRFRDILVAADVMEEGGDVPWVQIEIPKELEEAFLQALEGQ